MKTLMCFGDSNTHGSRPIRHRGESRRLPRDQRWPGVLAGHLGAGWHVIEEGLGARTTVFDDPVEGLHKNGSRMLLGLLETHKPLDAVTIMLGTNDQKSRFGLSGFDIAAGAGRLVETVQAFDVPHILLICPPAVQESGCLAEMFAGAEKRSADLRRCLAEEAERRGVDFLDANTHIATDPLDGVHFEAEAHAVLARAVADWAARIET